VTRRRTRRGEQVRRLIPDDWMQDVHRFGGRLGLTPFIYEPVRAAYFPGINEGAPTACNTAVSTVKSALGSGWWDRYIVDGLVKFVGGFVKTASWPIRLSETGYTQNYALVMVFGVLLVVGYVLWGTL